MSTNPNGKLPPGVEPATVTKTAPSAAQLKTRSEKVVTALEGDDEFSIASVDPDLRKPVVKLELEAGNRSESKTDARTLWRLFRKIF